MRAYPRCRCGCIPKGISQSKIMSLGDIAGYSRTMSIPRARAGGKSVPNENRIV